MPRRNLRRIARSCTQFATLLFAAFAGLAAGLQVVVASLYVVVWIFKHFLPPL